MDGRKPCDVCGKQFPLCDDCPLYGLPIEYQCANWNCFLNHEGDCMISLFERCGAWKGEASDA